MLLTRDVIIAGAVVSQAARRFGWVGGVPRVAAGSLLEWRRAAWPGPARAMSKRGARALALAPRAKRARGGADALALVAAGPSAGASSSSLPAPIMLLEGHGAAVRGVAYSHDGASLASCSDDKTVLLWRQQGEEIGSYAQLAGHKGAVVRVGWGAGSERVLSASADKTARAWDAETGLQVKKMAEHGSFVNDVSAARRGPPLVATVADDGTCKVWDLRKKRSAQTLEGGSALTAVAFGDAGDSVFTGGIDNQIRMWDLRRPVLEAATTLKGHKDTVTGLSVSPDGNTLLSNSMDNSLCAWDVRPFVAGGERFIKALAGHLHTFEQDLLRCGWSSDNRRVAAGSGDGTACVWDLHTAELQYKLPGHKGSVAEVVFHPTEPVIASAGADGAIYLGEISTDE